jgi:hypothetical protein
MDMFQSKAIDGQSSSAQRGTIVVGPDTGGQSVRDLELGDFLFYFVRELM